MKERRVSTAEVEGILKNPDRLESGVKGRTNAFKSGKGRHIRVTYVDFKDHRLVITVVMRQKPFKE